MKTTLTPNGPPVDGVTPVTKNVVFDVEVVASGTRREDGLTAAEVRQELKEEREANSGS